MEGIEAFIVQPNFANPFPPEYVVFSIIIALPVIILSTVMLSRILYVFLISSSFRWSVLPLIIILASFLAFRTLSCLGYGLLLITESASRINMALIYLTVLGMFVGGKLLIKQLVRKPRYRVWSVRYTHLILDVIIGFIFLSSLVVFLNRTNPSLLGQLVLLSNFLMISLNLVILLTLFHETYHTDVLLTKNRLKLLCIGFFGILLTYLLAMPASFFINPENESIFLYVPYSIFVELIYSLALFAFFWSFFLPHWIRKRFKTGRVRESG